MRRMSEVELKGGESYRLGWNCFNEGEMIWHHDRTDESGVWGKDEYSDGYLSEEVHNNLYGFQGDICRGSGAEPLWILEEGETYKDIPYTRKNELTKDMFSGKWTESKARCNTCNCYLDDQSRCDYCLGG